MYSKIVKQQEKEEEKKRDSLSGQEYKSKWKASSEKIYKHLRKKAKEGGVAFEMDHLFKPEVFNIKNAAPIGTFAEMDRFSEVTLFS